MKKIISTLLLLVMSVSLFAGCGAEKYPTAYSLYCGLNDEDTGTQIIPTEEAQKIARKIITDKGFGYTEQVAYGAYRETEKVIENETLVSAKVIENVTLVYDLYYMEKADVDKLADEIREALNLTPILVVEGSRNYEHRK